VQRNITTIMSTRQSTRPSYFPQEQEKHTNETNRSISPQGEDTRRLFSKTWEYISRYSIPTEEKNENGEYRMTDNEVRYFLKQEVRELSTQDPLINLLLMERRREIDLKRQSLMVGAYKLVSPSIKELNDIYFGPNLTDEFIEEVNASITKEISNSKGRMLGTNFKRGTFIMNFSALINGSGRTPEKVLKEKVEEIHKITETILKRHIETRISSLRETHKRIQQERSTTESSNTRKLKKIDLYLEKIEENIAALEKLRDSIATKRETVKITFGFNPLSNNSKSQYSAIRNAECAANIAALQQSPNPTTIYKDERMVVELIKGMRLLRGFGIFEEFEDGVRIKDEWTEFFFIDEEGQARMQPEMIKIFRRGDKYKKSKNYITLSPEKQTDFDDKIEKFGEYYSRINVIDILKNFQERDFETYMERIRRIVELIIEAKISLTFEEDNSEENKKRRQTLNAVSQELEVSLKDKGTEVVKTTRASIKALMEEGSKLIVLSDNIGFGGLNQGSYESSALQLIKDLEISDEEWQAAGDSEEALESIIKKKLEGNDHFQKTVMEIGDIGTEKLRSNEKALATLFPGLIGTINADGGDEGLTIYQLKGEELEEEIKSTLKQFSDKYSVRIAAVLTNLQLPTTREDQIHESVEHQTRIVSKNQRQAIIEWLQTLQWGEAAHTDIKTLNATGENKIEFQTNHPISQ